MDQYHYKHKKYLMTERGHHSFKSLRKIIGDGYYIFPQIHLGTITKPQVKWSYRLVERLVCIASVFHASGWENGGMLKPGENPPQFLADSYVEISPDGADHYPVVVKKLNEMHSNSPSLASDDLKNIKVRTLIMVGDDDEVYLEHALNFYRSLPNSELAVVPGTSHGLLPEKPELCNKIILDFLSRDPVQTFAPIRRA